jgi:predicted Zn-dependent protease
MLITSVNEPGPEPGGRGRIVGHQKDRSFGMRVVVQRFRVAYLALLLIGIQTGCARNPVTGQLQLALIPEAQEIEMGRQGAAEVERSIGLVPDTALQNYVQRLGLQMARTSERPNLPWRFGVVDDPTPNAFALPGGPIYFTRGMLSLMNSEAELAAVLGHEIGHITARHQVAMISRAQVAQLGLGLGGVLFPQIGALGDVAGAGMSLLFLRYSRDAERQADDLGFNYALQQGYDVREMAAVFQSLARLGGEQRSAVPAWLQTHPLPAERIAAVEQRIAATELPAQLRVGRPEFLTRIDGMVYGVNPRNGFFRDGLFLHPDLRFQIAFPANWQRQNLSQAVMAVSPQQNAAIQLTLSGDGSPEAAAQRFLRQQGVQAGQTSRQTINGLPAVVANFRAATQDAVVQGLGAWITYEGRIYQVLTYAMVAAYPQYQGTFQQSIGSFNRVTDPAVLNVRPNRIRIVRVPESMTLAEFNRRFPSVIPPAELAVINRLPSPDATVPAGAQLKRVVTGG